MPKKTAMYKHKACHCDSCVYQKKVKNDTISIDCSICSSKNTFLYMVKHELWYSAKVPHRECVCIPCFEKAIGRELTIVDFLDCNLNEPLFDGFLGAKSHIMPRAIAKELIKFGNVLRQRIVAVHMLSIPAKPRKHLG